MNDSAQLLASCAKRISAFADTRFQERCWYRRGWLCSCWWCLLVLKVGTSAYPRRRGVLRRAVRPDLDYCDTRHILGSPPQCGHVWFFLITTNVFFYHAEALPRNILEIRWADAISIRRGVVRRYLGSSMIVRRQSTETKYDPASGVPYETVIWWSPKFCKWVMSQ